MTQGKARVRRQCEGQVSVGVTGGVSSDGEGADLMNHSSMVGAFGGRCVPRVWYMLYVHWAWGGWGMGCM